ncbi:high-affinity nicotinic acid transporter [Cladorrhinum sp. PSN259]|nr:high-affinity nicotinic acid transporter [Cladorrhinum sp. PSN259]
MLPQNEQEELELETVSKKQKEAERINRKLDIYLLPLLSLLYLFNGLDRGNIGNAQTQGFTHDIGASPEDLNYAVSLFFITFVFFQPISATVGRWLGPHRWLPIMMMCWGLVTAFQINIHGRGGLITTRLLIGVFEAGFYPTSIVYLGYFYSRFDLGRRIALFFGQYAIASAFSGVLSYGIFQISHPSLKPWQLLFLIEGVLTCILAVVAWVWLPVGPQNAWFLCQDEQKLIKERIQPETEVASNWKTDVIETCRDWKLWFVLVCNICASVPATAFSVFLPLVVEGMGYTSVEANLMSVPPAVCGAFGVYMFAWSSDRQKERCYHIVGALLVALVGLVALIISRSDAAKYAALCVFIFGSYAPPPLTAAWLSNNTPAGGKRALVIGINGWGNLAGVAGSQLYRTEYAPEYKLPLFVTLAFLGIALPGYVGYRCVLQAANKGEWEAGEEGEEEGQDEEQEIEEGERAAETVQDTSGCRYSDRTRVFVYGFSNQFPLYFPFRRPTSPRLVFSPPLHLPPPPTPAPQPHNETSTGYHYHQLLLPPPPPLTAAMPRAPKSPQTPVDARRGPYIPRPPASEEDRLPVHPRKNKVPADKRKRVAMACHECNVRRVKCTGCQPCEQCVTNGRDCEYPRADAKRQVSCSFYDYLMFRTAKLSYLAGVGPNPKISAEPNADGHDPELLYLQMDDWERAYEPRVLAWDEASSQAKVDRAVAELGLADARMLIDSAGTTRLFGRSSGACFLDGVKEVMAVAGPLSQVIGIRQADRGRWYGEAFLSSVGRYQTYDSRALQLSDAAPYQVPSTSEISRSFELLRKFLSDGNGEYKTGGIMFWNFPRASLIAGMSEEGKKRPGMLPPVIHHRPKLAFGHALLAFASLLEATGPESRVEGRGKLGEQHYSTAKALIGGPLDGRSYTKDDLPTLALMALYLVENNRRDQASTVIGLAMQTAMAHGMHSGFCTDEADVRTFWTLYIIDRWLACILGRPVKIPEQDVSTALPQHCEGLPSHEALLAHVRLSQISHLIVYDNYFSLIHNQLSTQMSAEARIMHDLHNLQHWLDGLPESLTLPADPLDAITLSQSHLFPLDIHKEELAQNHKRALEIFTHDRGCLSLHMSHNQLLIISVRPAYLSAVQKAIASIVDLDKLYELNDDPQAPAILACTTAAQRNLRLGWLIRERSPNGKLLIPDLHHIFNAALILIMHQIVSRNFRVSLTSEIDWAYDLFAHEAGMGSPFAEDCRDVLGGFRQLAGALHSTVHSMGVKQALWESSEEYLRVFLRRKLPEHTFSNPFKPLFARPTANSIYDNSSLKIDTVSKLLDRWKEDSHHLLYSRPLS